MKFRNRKTFLLVSLLFCLYLFLFYKIFVVDKKITKISCDQIERNYTGPLQVTFEAPSFEQIAEEYPNLKPGGLFEPKFCEPANVAIVIPCRNREQHLRAFLHHMHAILQRQLLKYQFFVVEQYGNDVFNKATLMNIGFTEAYQLGNWDYVIFHDVDLFVEDDRAQFTCPDGPVHLAGYLDKVKLLNNTNLHLFIFSFLFISVQL